ncbi:MAG: hypothetical protein GX088_00515 [Clostridia bacterium]|nr:hypothetical protein [Clostridia bacterium]
MKQFCTRIIRLIFGLFLYAVGIVVTLNAHIGYAPWDVFHVGLAKATGISIGTASITTGLVIIMITALLGEKLGLGSLLNMVLIGVFMDILLAFKIIPVADSFAVGLVMLIAGLYINALATYFYIGSALGAGPRDSLMVALTRKTGLPIGVCRGTIEISAVLVGWKLGGMVGVGTIISAFVIGFAIQTTFALLKFDATAVRHETLDRTLQMLFGSKTRGLPEGVSDKLP